MDEVFSFFKTKLGKLILIVFAIIVISVIVKKQLEKMKYNGMTKQAVIDAVSSAYANERISWIKANDTNVTSGAKPLVNILEWYDQNAKPNIKDSQLKSILKGLGVDFVKYPDILQIKSAVDNQSMLMNYA